MIVSRTELEATKMPELKKLVVGMGGDPSMPGETKANLVDRILLQGSKEPSPTPQEQAVLNALKNEKDGVINEHTGDGPRRTKKDEPQTCTIADVMKMANGMILRGMKVYHNADEKTWMFRVQIKSSQVRDTLTGETRIIQRYREDSGTLNQPLSTIRRCASILMQSAMAKTEAAPERDPTTTYKQMA